MMICDIFGFVLVSLSTPAKIIYVDASIAPHIIDTLDSVGSPIPISLQLTPCKLPRDRRS